MEEIAFLFRSLSRSLLTELQVAIMRGMQHWTTSPLKEELANKKVLMLFKSNLTYQAKVFKERETSLPGNQTCD